MDLNRATTVGPITSSGPDFNSRATGTSFSTSMQKKPSSRDNKRILALNFIEVILADRQQLLDFSFNIGSKGKASLLYLKFKFLGQTYHTKFISLNENQFENRGGVAQM